MDTAASDCQRAALAFLASPEVRREWRPFYDHLYGRPPVRLPDEHWLVAGRDDVLAGMRSEGAELTALYPATRSPAVNELLLRMLPFESGPNHRRLRAFMRPMFGRRTISRLEAAVADVIDEQLYPSVFDEAGCDVTGTLGVRVPEALSCLLLDVAPADREEVGQWSRTLYAQIGRYDQTAEELREAEEVLEALVAYVHRRLEGPARETYGGVGETLIAARRRGDLSDEQLEAGFALFLLTGLDTLTYGIGNAVWFLGNEPNVFATLRDAPHLAPVAFREALRLWGPIRLCVRHLHEPVALETATLPEGALVFLVIHAANRDPRRFDEPDQLSWTRPPQEDLAFGVGPHGCLGTALGRLVGRLLYASLVTSCDRLWVTPGPEEPAFIPSLPILGVDRVRLFAEPSRRARAR